MADQPQPEQSRALVRTPADRIMEQVSHQRIPIERVLPEWMTVERFLTQVRFALRANPRLADCEPESVVASVMQAADLGLDPSGRLGSAYLVPYGKKCQLIPGYRGLIDLACRSGFVKSVNAWVVHELDKFDYRVGSIPKHTVYLPKSHEQDNPGPVYAAWCRVMLRHGGAEAEVMSLAELDAIRARSASVKFNKTDSPWFTDREQMYVKTVIRRCLKKQPLSPTAMLNATLERFSKALEHDDEVDGESSDVGETEVDQKEPVKQSKTEQLKKDL